ncbi:unnamed protein product [Paramecium octaurelia]|uniref:Uncharacterized protein n=1 Tax=Paramecium octaurelia TaxID=43137 RepID=A0A8S1XL15_PAROT|nr:unnamed protein product [Paramecium octaurelia]
MNERFSQPLYYKIEAVMINLINSLVDDEIKRTRRRL